MKVEQIDIKVVDAAKNKFDASDRYEVECEVIQGDETDDIVTIRFKEGPRAGQQVKVASDKVKELKEKKPKKNPDPKTGVDKPKKNG